MRALINEALSEKNVSKLEDVAQELLVSLSSGKQDACEELFVICAETALKVRPEKVYVLLLQSQNVIYK